MSTLQKGADVLVRHEGDGHNYAAKVIQTKGKQVKVHYKGKCRHRSSSGMLGCITALHLVVHRPVHYSFAAADRMEGVVGRVASAQLR